MDNLADDPGFIDAIVHEVKSQGHFDQFRKECLADVDTKPAYQNLRQRVESSVSKFLSQQKWTDNIRHKNQLREKLRKNIIESGFLETGVERIVDQVVNPKISTVFHPKVEEIVYSYLGIEKPKPVVNGGGLDVQTDFLPEDLEAVSPDSDKKSSSTSSDVQIPSEQTAHEELNESKENVDDFESPAFEPLETRPPSQTKHESNDSHASAISGLTSQESVEDEHVESVHGTVAPEAETVEDTDKDVNEQDGEACNVDEISHPVNGSPEIAQNDSQLSQVSSNSRLSIITSSEGVLQPQQAPPVNPRLDITEEAQMPKFNENSNEEEGELPESNDEDEPVAEDIRGQRKSNFDLRKESYEFTGTERSNRFFDAEIEPPVEGSAGLDDHDFVNNGESYEHKDDAIHIPGIPPTELSSPIASAKYEDNSSHSERSLRICEDSTMEQKALDTSSHLDNCDSVKTPLNDEHSTQSAPDVEKMDSSQVEVVTLAAVQQHVENEKKPDRHRERDRDDDRDRKHSSSHRHHSSSSSRDRRSHSSSKHSSSGSSRKSDHRERKGENGNSNSNSGSSKRTHDKKKHDDDHYSSHEKPTKKRRSTDRDSNDGADHGKPARPCGVFATGSGTKETSSNYSHSPQKRSGGIHESQAKLNDSLESSFEGFDEEQLHSDPNSSLKKAGKLIKITKCLTKGKTGNSSKTVKKVKRQLDRSSKETDRKNVVLNMDVFTFSFDKPAKLGKNSEVFPEDDPIVQSASEDVIIDDKDIVLREESQVLSSSESLDQIEGVIVLEPTEIEKVIRANDELGLQEVTSSIDDDTLQPLGQKFPTTDPADLVTLATQPVVVDQMLTNGDNMDLELLIGKKQLCGDESTLDKIQQGLDVVRNRIKKPKIASNFSEARKLMKIRKQIEREEKKKREQAMVLAKKLISENGIANIEDQGIELEFVCDSNRKSSGPIISSPVRQKGMLNNTFQEDDLLYFPEEKEVFPHNEELLAYLKQKTRGVSYPTDFETECFNLKLHSLEIQAKSLRREESPNSFLEDEPDEVLAIEITETLNNLPVESGSVKKDDDVGSGVLQQSALKMELDTSKLQKMRASSIDSNHATESELKGTEGAIVSSQKSRKSKHLRSPQVASAGNADVDYDNSIKSHRIAVESSTSEDNGPKNGKIIGTAEPIKENKNNQRKAKSKRLGLPRPRGIINNHSTAILKVDIADVKPETPEGKSPTANNNNNGAIKTQRYSSDDLYKPRALNGLRTRTRTRASEGVRTEVGGM